MEQLDPLAASAHAAQHSTAKKSEKKEKTKKMSFADLLGIKTQSSIEDEFLPQDVANLPLEEAVIVLKDRVDLAGDSLKAGSSKETLAAYRKAVSDFMGFIIHSNYKVEVRESRRRTQNYRRYLTVRVINEKLEQLASDLLANHCDKLSLLARIDEINGILIDLLT